MLTFVPTTTEPGEALLDSIETFLREGHPDLHDPAPPAWASGPCPAGHFTLPEGVTLYRGDQPAEAEAPYLLLTITGDCERHVLDDDRIWNIPVALHYVENRDAWVTNDIPDVLRELQNDLLADAAIIDEGTGAIVTSYPATERMSTDALHVYYIYDVQLQSVQFQNGHPGYTLLFKVRCAGITPE